MANPYPSVTLPSYGGHRFEVGDLVAVLDQKFDVWDVCLCVGINVEGDALMMPMREDLRREELCWPLHERARVRLLSRLSEAEG